MEDNDKENLSGNKDYIISILEEMNEEELDSFEVKFQLLDKREILTHIIHNMNEEDEDTAEKLSDIYAYVRDAYWAGE